MPSSPSDRWSLPQRGLAALLILAVSGGAAILIGRAMQPSGPELWRQAQAEAERQGWSSAFDLAERALLAGSPTTPQRIRAGSFALKAGKTVRAAELFAQIDNQQFGAADAQRQIGAAWLANGHVAPAEQAFLKALALDPANIEARLALAELLRLSGRYFELEPHMPVLIAAAQCPSALLFAVAWPDKTWLDDADREQIQRALQTDPQAAWIAFATASADALTPETRLTAIQQARSVAMHDQTFAEAFARWGTLLVEAEAWDQLVEWNRALSDAALAHPQVWSVRGLWQLHHDDSAAAIRCFWEALERSPFHVGSTYQLSLLLPRTDHRDHADGYIQQAKKLAELRQQVIFGKGAGGFPDPDVMRQIVTLLSELGRDWEALGWCQLASTRHPELRWPAVQISERQKNLAPDSPWVADKHRLSRRIRLDHFPLPKWDTSRDSQPANSPQAASHDIAFSNVAARHGLEFQYTNGSPMARPHGFMYEISGGGVGVLDYDLDGWPDLFLTDGGPSLNLSRDPTKTDRLFRNQFGERVLDVTAAATVIESGYGQGVAVGDVNSDGFPDLFVTNIGPNQLWINQGDGTFRDGTAAAGFTGTAWSIGASLADLDGDGLTDIFVVNYLGGDALSRTCLRDDAVIQCRPSMFPAEPDRVWRNEGDGRFVDVTKPIGADHPAGKGMGIVAADFDRRGHLSLFVSNDSEPNSFFRPEGSTRGAMPRYAEDAIPLGLAYGVDGSPLASMGIAVDDVNQDGRFDLYVTNFLSEGSNLYFQDDAGFYADRARSLGIYEASVSKMGWGAQFVDADLDGWPDLIVANGHLEDYRRWKIESFMPTQCFRNRNGQHFDLLSTDHVGSYFGEQHFGRTVVRFDGNRDGREDVIVTHVDAPVAWLQNTSSNTGHFLAVKLIGATTERDAIGARLTASVGGRTLYKQLIAGDGFQASNQRQIVFGLGTATNVDELRIDWPSGHTQRFENPPVDREIIVRENQTVPVVLEPHHHPHASSIP